VAVALSVDGLNTLDARETTAAAARKWMLAPYEVIVISGWQTSQTEARRFEFTTEEKSNGRREASNLGCAPGPHVGSKRRPASNRKW
jgi:hypothetical protein